MRIAIEQLSRGKVPSPGDMMKMIGWFVHGSSGNFSQGALMVVSFSLNCTDRHSVFSHVANVLFMSSIRIV